MPEVPFTDGETWFAGLPATVIAAAALITDAAGRVLLVKPNYRDNWALPGGICEHGEPPHEGCRRELAEELGLPIPVGRMLAADWSQPYGERARSIMHFIFDGGQLDEGAPIVIQQAELDGYRFTDAAELAGYLNQTALRRVQGALRSKSSGRPIYLPLDLS